jgi:molybdenum cofactor guanylyltransferase
MPRDQSIAGTAVVVLAGGQGRRIGGAKPLRRLAGERLIDRAVAAARRFSEHIAISVGTNAEFADLGVESLSDRHDWGALAGLQAAIAFAGRIGLPQVLTLPCDSPFVPNDLLSRLHPALSPDKGAAIPLSGGRLHLACGLWNIGTEGVLNEYGGSGGRSLHGLAERLGIAEVEWSMEPFDPFFNINSQEDLDEAEAMIAHFRR